MLTKELQIIVKDIAKDFNIEAASLAAFIEVESGGQGFNSSTGKILIKIMPKIKCVKLFFTIGMLPNR